MTLLVTTMSKTSLVRIIFVVMTFMVITRFSVSTQARVYPQVKGLYQASFNGVNITTNLNEYVYGTRITIVNDSNSAYQHRFSIFNGFILEDTSQDDFQFILRSHTNLKMFYTCEAYHVILFQDVNLKVLEWHVVADGENLTNPFHRLDTTLPRPAQGPLRLINEENSWINSKTGERFEEDKPIT